jgi:protocatechuate 3,4-dioxygenase beta subunit
MPAQRRPEPRGIDADGNQIHEEDRGLGYDLQTLLGRRRLLGLLGGAGLLAACSSGSADPTSGATPATEGTSPRSPATTSGDLTEVPDETGGPFPGDGSNGPNVLDDTGIVRRDIRSSYDTSTTTAEGVPLAIRLTVRDAATGDALTGAAVYVWHCDRDGRYSLYSDGATQENYLRGVQETDATGTATFDTIYPGCYPGRWPHVHFEVYQDLARAVSAGPIVKTSQLAFPKEVCEAAYAATGYEQSIGNLGSLSLASDIVFADDGGIHQLASMSGDSSSGFTAALTIGV